MKNLQISDKDIERLFEKAVNQPPIVNDEKVQFLLYNAPKPASSKNSFKHFFTKHLNLIIMSTIVSSILIGLTMLIHANHTQTSTQASKAKMHSSISKKSDVITANKPSTKFRIETKYVTNIQRTKSNSPVRMFNSVSATSFSNVSNTNNLQPDLITPTAPLPEWDGKPASGDQYILELTNDELKNLGVLLNDSDLYYLNISPAGIISGYNRPYFEASYEERLQPNFKRKKPKKAKIESTVSFNSFYIYYSTNEQIINSFNNMSVSYYNKLKSVFPTTNQTPFYYRGDLTYYTKSLFHTLDSLNENTDRNFLYDIAKLPLKSMDDTLVPVLIHQKTYTDPIYKTRILWFVSNNDFYNALPARYQGIKNFYETQKLLKKKYPDANLVDYSRHYEFYDYMESLNYIDLSKDELKRIGIRFINKGNDWNTGIEYRTKNGSQLWCKNPNTLAMTGGGSHAKIDVFAVFHSTFKEKILYKIPTGQNADSLPMKELIPIRIKKDFPEGYQLDDDMIFWFAPTEAFFDSLPARIGNELKLEYKNIMIRRDPSVPLEVKTKLSSSCSYFEECKATLFSVNINLWPNPFSDNLNIDLQLQEADKITISIFSMGGRKIQSLMPFTILQAGMHHFTYSASNISAGIYLLTVQNTKGQIKSQRIIKI